jgi:Zn-dependent protease/CBS domain-containing protein
MRWSIRVARIFGIDVKVHVTFLILILWIALSYYSRAGLQAALEGTAFNILLFGCVLLHELGHALAALRYGIATADITLLPIGGVARITRMPRDPKQELVIAVAGPSVNVVIALLLFLLVPPGATLSDVLAIEDPGVGMASKLMVVNAWLVMFNLIPAFPMDGGRILRSLLAMRMPFAQATQIAASLGQGLALVFGFIGLFFNPLLVFIALFIYLGATQEAAIAQMRELGERLPVSAVMMTNFLSLSSDDTLQRAAELLMRTPQRYFPVVDASGRLVGALGRDDVVSALARGGGGTRVAEVMKEGVPAVSARAPVEWAFELMREKNSPLVAVAADDQSVKGIVTAESVGDLFLLHSALNENGAARRRWFARRAAAG